MQAESIVVWNRERLEAKQDLVIVLQAVFHQIGLGRSEIIAVNKEDPMVRPLSFLQIRLSPRPSDTAADVATLF